MSVSPELNSIFLSKENDDGSKIDLATKYHTISVIIIHHGFKNLHLLILIKKRKQVNNTSNNIAISFNKANKKHYSLINSV